MLSNKTLMITGGTGSFGKAVLRKFLKQDLKKIIIFSRDELKQEQIRHKYNDPKLSFVIGDVRDYSSVLSASQGVDYIFHAAALKQVPSCEFYPMEAVKTNIIGTENIVNAASTNKIKKVVFLSTDKAVYPVNAMGVSKSMAEKVVLAKARSSQNDSTVFCITRYGNVMLSRGSVIPLFISQIKNNKDITITDPNMTRFLMTLEESVNLVSHAFEKGTQGELFVQKSPATQVNILALALKELFNSKVKIKIIGTRHGEKLYETLISREEKIRSTEEDKYYKISIDGRDLNYTKYFTSGEKEISQMDDYTSHNTHLLNLEEVKQTLIKLDFIKNQII
ncbi:polysaccharide biosynthesis protein [Alphaproteobacteria bacterium]|nr:polysaccharide biosynthesis protein [Alphaproteobacteria bacterium]